jgi:O-antigen ligase
MVTGGIAVAVIALAAALTIALLVFSRPFLGIVFMAACLPVMDLLPQVPYVTSVLPLVGAVTIVAALESRRRNPLAHTLGFTSVAVLGLLLIGWVFIISPKSTGLDSVRVYLQLWVLAWLSGELLDTPEKQRVLMWVFAVASAASALAAVGQGRLGGEFAQMARGGGFAWDANTAARYFLVAFLFINYLRTAVGRGPARVLAIAGMAVTLLGLLAAASRTGILLLVTALGLMALLPLEGRSRRWLLTTFLVVISLSFVLWDSVNAVAKTIVPAVSHGTDTLGLRYKLWQAGWRMWLEHPIAGVGIGQYTANLARYAPATLKLRYYEAVAHSMYVAMLAETGIVGLGFFLSLLYAALRNLLVGSPGEDPDARSLRYTWLVAFLVMLIGGITKTDQTDKLLWLVVGMSAVFRRHPANNTQYVHMTATPVTA